MTTLCVGTVAVLNRPMLGCAAGARGVCYEAYTIGDRPGWSFIFENGSYDGFSPDDLQFLHVIGHDSSVEGYHFENVGELRHDFEQGRFATALLGFASGPAPS